MIPVAPQVLKRIPSAKVIILVLRTKMPLNRFYSFIRVFIYFVVPLRCVQRGVYTLGHGLAGCQPWKGSVVAPPLFPWRQLALVRQQGDTLADSGVNYSRDAALPQ